MSSIERAVSASLDDCVRSTDTIDYFVTNVAEFQAGYALATYKDFGSAARFLNIAIPPESIITLAKLKMIANTDMAAAIVNTRIRCEKNINPATFSTKANFDARTWTTAFVSWDAIPAWTNDVEYESPDVKACVQEAIDLPGWVSGNPIVVLWDDFEQRSTAANFTYRRGSSYDGDAAKAPKLYIEYLSPLVDTNAILRAYLAADANLIPLVGARIYCPRLPENATLPAIGFFTRGGSSNPHISDLPSPSIQFDCWADNPIEARHVYRALYAALQGIQNVSVGANRILSAREEVQGVDLVDIDMPNYFRVLTFFEVIIA